MREVARDHVRRCLQSWRSALHLEDKERWRGRYSLALHDLLRLHQEEWRQARGDEAEELRGRIKEEIQFINQCRREEGYQRISFQGQNFDGFYLAGLNLQRADCHAASFLDTVCRGTIFAMADCGHTWFTRADCLGADFHKANLENAQFNRARLGVPDQAPAKFALARCHNADFTDIKGWRVNFSEADLEGASFCRADLEGADFSRASLRYVRFHESTVLHGVRLFRCNLEGSTLEGVRRQFISDHLQVVIRPEEQEGRLEEAMDVYGNLKRYFAREYDHSTAGAFFIRERELRRCLMRQRWRSLTELRRRYPGPLGMSHRIGDYLSDRLYWVMETFLYRVGKYGEHPFEVLLAGGLIVLLFSILYGVTDALWDTLANGPVVHWYQALEYLYFSLVTFTTLGFGDIHPNRGIVQLLAAMEAGMGAFLIAYFVVLWGRKIEL